jgi:hypothetical protein
VSWKALGKRVAEIEESVSPGAVAIAAIEFGRSAAGYAAARERMRAARARLRAAGRKAACAGPALVTIVIAHGAREGRRS